MEQDNRKTKDLRVFAIGIFIITGLIAGLMFYREHHLAMYILGGFSLYGLLSIAVPVMIIPLFIVFSYLGKILGWINTRLLLGLIFYLVFSPIGIFFRLTRRDVLDRSFDKLATSYWKDINHISSDLKRYEKQF